MKPVTEYTNKIIWKTRNTYVDIETGQILTEKQVKKQYIITKKIKKTYVNNKTGTSEYTNECRRNPQRKLF